ncbi:MAG TPA: VOC family protein, partial [Solirubrobacterales bacterium]
LTTPDVEAAAEFYGALFGWEVPELANSAEMGGYRRAKKGGKDVAGVYPLMEEGQPPAWATYVSVSDAAATAALIKENGGSVIVEPMDIGMGHMAVFADPSGAVFGLWQPVTFAGAELVNEPGAFCWAELNTRDLDTARPFYGDVFGWTFEEKDMGDAGSYTTIDLSGDPVGGILNMTERGVPEQVPAHWQVYFAVEDTDATVEKAKAGGGNVMVEPIDIPIGRFSILVDPHGASFGVIALSAEARENA